MWYPIRFSFVFIVIQNEAIQESVKNMLLVMESANLFLDENNKGSGQWSFWEATWQRVDQFLPNLKDELYRHHSPSKEIKSVFL